MRSDLSSPKDKALESPFEVAKEVLSIIGRFRTPPIPEVYEVLYRYVDGQSVALREQLDYLLRDLGEVTVERLLGIKEQFLCSSPLMEMNQDMVEQIDTLAHEMQDTTHTNKSVLDEFETQLENSCNILVAEAPPEKIQCFVATVLTETARVSEQMSDMATQLNNTTMELARLRQQVEELQASAFSDPLTGVGNRRKFEQELQKIRSLEHSAGNLHLFMIDLDLFKEINDSYGHSAGDQALRFVAKALEEIIPNATVCRFGGDEFAVFAKLHTEEVMNAAEELCNYFAGNEISIEEERTTVCRVTVSGGAAIYRIDDSADSFKTRADKLLYNAKTSGRKKILVERDNSRARQPN